MSSVAKIILVLLADTALLVYTVMNYMAGKTSQTNFMILIALLSYIMVSMVAQLIRELRK